MSAVRLCGLPKSDGTPCRWRLNRPCPYHGPHASDETRREITYRGGVASALRHALVLPANTQAPALESPAGVRALLADTIQQARTGRLDARIASVVIAGVVAAIKLAELEVAAQIGDLERRFRLRRA